MEGWLFNALSCREVSRRAAAGALEDGSAPERLLLRLHFLICSHCRRFARQMRWLGAAARAWAGRLVDPARQAEVERRLIERLSAY